jgi:hypothetical protein
MHLKLKHRIRRNRNVGILELLTIIFVVLKIVGTVDWSWWLVLLPEIIAVVFYGLWVGLLVIIGSKLGGKL